MRLLKNNKRKLSQNEMCPGKFSGSKFIVDSKH